jgi:RNA polymerase sigma factor (TIGR02999 family)
VGGRPAHDITALLDRAAGGDESASEALVPLLYDELRALAGSFFRGRTPAHTLQPTALVHELYLKLDRARPIEWESRGHFLAVAARAMRQILANHAEARRAAKRGGNRARVTLSGVDGTPAPEVEGDLLDLDDAMRKLEALSPDQARVVELRFLAGGDEEEVARMLDVSPRTVRRRWRMARAFLRSELSGDAPS